MSERKILRLGTRASRLALWQADHVAALLKRVPGAPRIEIVTISTEGDRIQNVPLSEVRGQAFFTKEIEHALLDGRVDLAVHSLKDLATQMPEGLNLAAIPEREDPRDVIVSRNGEGLAQLAPGARVGTSSLRRKAFLARLRPDLELAELRGNVPTRLGKLEAGDYDAVILAAAGVKRLGFSRRISEYLVTTDFPPAAGQGALALQVRSDDVGAAKWIGRLDDRETRQATTAERSFLRRVEGGCQVPVGALATINGDRLTLVAGICALNGSRAVSGQEMGFVDDAEEIGCRLGARLLAEGGEDILSEIRPAAEDRP